jgi:4-hydroxy-tetrahydrodipicolinate synthase
MNPRIKQSLYAAVLTPRDRRGGIDEAAFRGILEFLLNKRISGFVLNGATGEYSVAAVDEVERLLFICRDTAAGRAEFLCGVGSAAFANSAALADIASDCGAAGLLLPMPHFFPYSQDDLKSYSIELAGRARLPVLLYNLPRFTTPLEPATVTALIAEVPNIVGIKDSSGSFDIFCALYRRNALRFVGDDAILVRVLDNGLCEGVISGVAGVLPELTRFLACKRSSPDYGDAARMLDELVAQLSVFPTPWGLKLIAECRGIAPASYLQPVSEQRQQQMCAFRDWFGAWWPAVEELVGAA